MVDEAGAESDIALAWHLQSNHYPPLPAELVPVARRVIDKANRGDWDKRVRLPEGVSYRGSRLAPVAACVEAWHLDAFLEEDDDWGEDPLDEV
jgi:hypothetical protein